MCFVLIARKSGLQTGLDTSTRDLKLNNWKQTTSVTLPIGQTAQHSEAMTECVGWRQPVPTQSSGPTVSSCIQPVRTATAHYITVEAYGRMHTGALDIWAHTFVVEHDYNCFNIIIYVWQRLPWRHAQIKWRYLLRINEQLAGDSKPDGNPNVFSSSGMKGIVF